MNAHRLLGKCECGGYAQPQSLWITDQKSLLVTCFCIVCEKQINVVFPLTELFKQCPKPTFTAKQLREIVGKENALITGEAGKPLTPPLSPFVIKDWRYLKEMHIVDEEKEQPQRTVSDIINDVDSQFPPLGGVQ